MLNLLTSSSEISMCFLLSGNRLYQQVLIKSMSHGKTQQVGHGETKVHLEAYDV